MKRSFYALLCAMLMCCAFLFVACDEEHTHSYTEEITKAATCTEAGEKTLKCSCGDTKTEVIPANGHSYGEWETVTNATCGAAGSKKQTCSGCGNVINDTIPATGKHNFATSTVTTEPTCNGTGVRTYKCACGAERPEIIPANGHSYGEWETVTDATCGAVGSKKKTCAGCGDIINDTIPATGEHNYVDGSCNTCGMADPAVCKHESWNDATCTTAKTCTACGKTEGNPLGHSYGEWETVTEANCITKGKRQKTCSTCGHDYVEETGFGSHSYGSWETVTAATCVTAGLKKHTCSVCNYPETEEIPATGIHSYVNGKCQNCGATMTSKEEYIAAVVAGNASANSDKFIYVIDQLKNQYDQLPEMPAIDINSILSQFNVYLKANVEGSDTVISVKDGYVTYKTPDGSTYIGYNKGNLVMTNDSEVINYTTVIPPELEAMLGSVAEGVPTEQLEAVIDMLKTLIPAFWTETFTFDASEITYKDGWYNINFTDHMNKIYNTEGSFLSEFIYSVALPSDADEEAKAQLDAMIEGILEAITFNIGVVMDGDVINGMRIDVALPAELVGSTMTVSLEIKFSADATKFESMKYNITVDTTVDTYTSKMVIDFAITANDGGMSAVTTVNFEQTMTYGDEIQKDTFGLTYNMNFSNDMHLTHADMAINSEYHNGEKCTFTFNADATYTAEGGEMEFELAYLDKEKDYEVSKLNVSGTLNFNAAGAPVKISINGKNIDNRSYGSSTSYTNVTLGDTEYGVVITAIATTTTTFGLSADITDIANGNATFAYNVAHSHSNARLYIEDYYGFTDAEKQLILSQISTATKESLLDCFKYGDATAAALSVKGNTITLTLDFEQYGYHSGGDVILTVDPEAKTGTLTVVTKNDDGSTTVMVGVDIEINSDKSTAPEQSIRDIISSFTPPTDGADGGTDEVVPPTDYPDAIAA